MLILIEQITRRGADSEPVVKPLGINPEAIEQVEPSVDTKIEGDCVVLSVHGDRRIFAVGTVEGVVKQAYEAVWGPPRQEPDDAIGAT
jgi:hypothetical protein